MNFIDLLKNFFTHKDFLPPADQIPGTMFTPLHFIFAAILAIGIAVLVVLLRKTKEKTLKIIFTALWAFLLVLEVSKIVWESVSGREIRFEYGGVLPLYPCSIFMYAMPFAIWGKGNVRKSACGYACTLGLLGGLINFVYPATILSNYSCFSFAGFHTFIFHGVLVFTACLMLVSGYHSFKNVTKWYELLLPAIPFLCVSVVANVVNFALDTDYCFLRMRSFIFAPYGEALGLWAVPVMYIAYLIIHAVCYLPSYICNKIKKKA